MKPSKKLNRTKRIQPARGWCATVGGGTVGGNTVQIVSTYPASPEARPPSFLGKPAVRPRSMAGGVPTACGRHLVQPRTKTNTNTRTQPPTLTKYTSSSVQPPQTFPPPLSLVHPPPKTPLSNPQDPHFLSTSPHTHSLHSRPNTTYTSRLSPHIPITQTSIRRNPNSTHPSSSHSHTRNKQETSKTKHKEINILQLNANGIRSTVEELKHLMHTTQPGVVPIQESKLTTAPRTPQIPHYTAIRTDREHKQGGGLITYIKSDTTFTHIKTLQAINKDNTEIQLLKIHIYIAPRNTTPRHHIHYGHRHNKLHTIHHQHT